MSEERSAITNKGLSGIFWYGLALAILSLGADQASKWAVMEGLFKYDFWVPAEFYPPAFGTEVTGFFNLVAVWNRGVSFGLFSNHSVLGLVALSAMALAIVSFLLYLLKKENSLYMASVYGLIIGGAVGNVLDRIRFGAVFDFLDFHGWLFDFPPLNGHWPAFNISDSLIFIGVAMWLFEGLFRQKAEEKG